MFANDKFGFRGCARSLSRYKGRDPLRLGFRVTVRLWVNFYAILLPIARQSLDSLLFP